MTTPNIIKAPVVHRAVNAPYLTKPGVAVMAHPTFTLEAASDFLLTLDPEFEDYLKDPDKLSNATALCKFAGQLCYMAFGQGRTKNADARRYFQNIRESGHGSVLEHANFSLLLYGISRDTTHELVRHRAGFGFSQVSQRYVDGRRLRFVERVEFQGDEDLHQAFLSRIERAWEDYHDLAEKLMNKWRGQSWFTKLGKTDQRKRVYQAARACLPNETEAPILVTANVRAWRHFLEMRANTHADVNIRRLAVPIFYALNDRAATLFEDYVVTRCDDELDALTNVTRKV